MELLTELSHFIERDSMKRFDGLPPVNQTVALTMLNADNPSLVIEAFIAGIADASPEIRNEIKLQYWITVMAMAKLEELQPNFFDTDVILPKPHKDDSDSLGDTDSGKINTDVSNFHKLGRLTYSEQITDTSSILKSERICLVCSDSDLENTILDKLPDSMKAKVDVIHLQGDRITISQLSELSNEYRGVILTDELNSSLLESLENYAGRNTIPTLVKPLVDDLNDELQRAQIQRSKDQFDIPSPIFNPRERGRTKGGFKDGHRRF